MIVDSSALIAILFEESEQIPFSDAIALAPTRLISSVTLLESSLVAVGKLGDAGEAELDALVAGLRLSIVPFTADHLLLARQAFLRFGKGRHPARLNFGDCVSYALAKASSERLLFKGGDFSRTDIGAADY